MNPTNSSNNPKNVIPAFARLSIKTALLIIAPLVGPLFLPLNAPAKALFGIDVLEKSGFKELRGAKVGVITNHTGVDRRGRSLVDLIDKRKDVRLICILSPEHGFRGREGHGEKIPDQKDPRSGVPIYSLYGKTTRPTSEMLRGVDTLVFDIQDIGTRFYTYITTMGQALEEAARHNIRFVVLDRPNPIRGDVIEGDILDRATKRFTGYFPLPTRHGLTVGEIANWMNEDQNLNARLLVIRLKNWKRKYWYDQTRHPFIPTSPNIPSLTSALLYSGIGCFEATNVSVGRGTDSPFLLLGAPWIKGEALCAHLRSLNLPGVVFDPARFIPTRDLYAGQPCSGVRLLPTDRNKIRPFQIFIHSFLYLYRIYPSAFKPEWEEVRVVTGSEKLREAVEHQWPVRRLLEDYSARVNAFRRMISAYYYY